MNIGIYGGTFSPPHLGHFQAALTAANVLNLDRLLLIPAAEPPHKKLPEETPDVRHRLAMTELMADALQQNGVKAEVSRIEIDRTGKSYTADTVTALHEQYPDAQLWLLMGTDMFLTLQNWYKPEVILRYAGVCAFGRTEQDGEEVFAPQREYLNQRFQAKITTITLPGLVDISSTQLREMLVQGSGRDYLLPAVYGYILRNRLYGTQADLKHLDIPELRACSYSMVKQKRVRHIMGTEEEAVRLAERWGANKTQARRAAILHDCTKYLELDEQLTLCREHGVELDELELQAVKLLHSKTGACIARSVYGEPDEVYWAIFWHTTAKADMTTLEKILYMADYIEPNRDFDGVECLRKLAYEDLDRALLLGVDTTIQEMHDRKLPIHRNTLAARAWLIEQGVEPEEV